MRSRDLTRQQGNGIGSNSKHAASPHDIYVGATVRIDGFSDRCLPFTGEFQMINAKSALAVALGAVAAGVIAPAPTWAGADDVATQIVDALNKRYGVHPGYRANHAKGIVVEGRFKATPEAATLTRSPIFAGATLPVTVRFSDAGGQPHLHDGSPAANPHG
jgi:hypothetical protein